MITMSVSKRIVQICQLDDGCISGYYGLEQVPSNGRRGWWFTGSVDAWRKLANDVDFRSVSGWDNQCAARKSDGLHARIDKQLAKANNLG